MPEHLIFNVILFQIYWDYSRTKMIKTLAHIVDNSAERFPDREAFKCGDSVLTYSQLQIKTRQLASYLQDAGVQKGDRVGVYLERSLESAIAIYGIMQAGAVFVPLDPSAPISRTAFLIRDCGIEHLITSRSQEKKVAKCIKNVVLRSIVGVDTPLVVSTISWDQIFAISLSAYQAVSIDENDLAYIMYTSGSTGLPKGIMHTHASGLSYARLSSSLYEVSPDDRLANHAPLHFDISTFGYFSGPYASACTVILQDAHTIFPVNLSSLIEKEQITIWYSVPLALIQLLEKGLIENYDTSSLRWVLFGGEVFISKYLTTLMELWPQATFSNVYGPAEVNQCTYYHLYNSSQIVDPLPLGTIWDETTYCIVDENNTSLTQAGVSGELAIHSTTMMKGYWNNEQLTAASTFIKMDTSGNERWYYKTGDIVQINEDGHLVFIGRNDAQVKVRGYRIDLGEIEAILTKHEKVQEAAIVLSENSAGEKEISAAVKMHPFSLTTPKDLKLYCKAQLPFYAIPGSFFILEDFPRNSSDKIDRKEIKKIIIQETV